MSSPWMRGAPHSGLAADIVRISVRTSRGDGRSTQPATTLPRPEYAEAAPMPGDDRLGFDDNEYRSPVDPDTRKPPPEQAVGARESQPPTAGPLQHVELVPQRKHFELQRGA